MDTTPQNTKWGIGQVKKCLQKTSKQVPYSTKNMILQTMLHSINFYRLLSLFFVLFLVGCETNYFEENYTVLIDEKPLAKTTRPNIICLLSEKQLKDLLRNDKYTLIGESKFCDAIVSKTLAIDCARKHGASLVAIGVSEGITTQYNSTVYMPTSSTTYHSGSVYSNYNIGNSVNYYGQSTTYGYTPITVTNHKTVYPQEAYFFVEKKVDNDYGISFELPQIIPGGENNDTSIRVLTVRKGSLAEKNGIKKGDIVKTINGEAIQSKDDVLPYINGTKTIRTIKVSHE